MLEKIKSGVLIFLILLSLILTYGLWFGAPPLEEGIMPRYEYAYFTDPCSLEEIVTPSDIIYFQEEKKEKHVFRRGEDEYIRLWKEGASVLKRLTEQTLSRISDDEEEALLETVPLKISFIFSTPLPIAFFVPELVSLALDVQRAVIIPEEHYYLIILEGKDKFAGRIFMNLDEQLLDNILPQSSNSHICLPDVLTLNLAGYFLNEDVSPADEMKESATAESKGNDKASVPLSSNNTGEKELLYSLEIKKKGELFVPLEDLQAAEIILKKENVDREQLVRAFFFDLSMARRIEERDGAVFFTDGEKGLRIYPEGLVEYTAPKLERVSTTLSYSAALQKGAESLGIYGGWFPGIYLARVEKQNEGYQLFWKMYYDGFPLEGKSAGSEMTINELGVLFYQRNLYQIIEEVGDKKAFRPYKEALCQAAAFYRASFPGNEGVLLGIRPVYYLSFASKGTVKATPAWSVSIDGMDEIYLHWQTLNPL